MKSAAQEGLVIADGIERTHQRINITMIGKYGHLHLLAEGRLESPRSEYPAAFIVR